mgnify:CR=1 FL=1
MPGSHQTATSTAQAKSPGGSSAQAETGGYWQILWHTQSPGEELRRAVAQDLEEPELGEVREGGDTELGRAGGH